MPHAIKLDTLFREKDGQREMIQAIRGEPGPSYDDKEVRDKLTELEKKIDSLIDAVTQVHNEVAEIMNGIY